jgi:hypothetical protein
MYIYIYIYMYIGAHSDSSITDNRPAMSSSDAIIVDAGGEGNVPFIYIYVYYI